MCDILYQIKFLVKLQIANDDSIFRVLHAKKMDVVPLFVALTKFIHFSFGNTTRLTNDGTASDFELSKNS